MKDKVNPSVESILRKKAEELLKNKSIITDAHFSDIDVIKLIHELDVHQVELEMQNEELLLAKKKLEIDAEKYTNLYDFAPSAYITLSKEGKIMELNFRGANLLGKERSLLLNNRFALFVSDETIPKFNLFLEEIFESKTRQTCELILSIVPNNPTYVYLSGIVSDNGEQCIVTIHDISQRKKAEEATKVSEEKYRTLFETNRDSITIFRIDKDDKLGNFIEVNPSTTTLFGYTKKELLAMSVRDIETLSDKKRKSRIDTLLSKGRIDFETIIKNKKGNLRNVEVETILINYLNEPAVMNITRDITERKQTEVNIRKAQENLATILEAIPDLLFEVDLEGRIYHYQAHREDLLAVTPAQFMGRLFQEVLPADVTKIILNAIEEANKKGWSVGKQYSLNLPQGKHWFELSASPIKNEIDKDKHFILLARDITERKLAEISLDENKQNLQSIFDSVLEAIYVIGENGTFIDANKGAEKMYSYSKQELIGKSPQIVAAPGLNDIDKVQKNIQKVFKTGKPTQFEFWAVRKNGEIFPKEVVLNKGKYFGKDVLIATARDISERKKAEEALQKSQEKLRGVFDLANSGIILTDLKGKYLLFNNWCTEAFGYTRAEMNKLSSKDLTHPDDLEKSNLFFNKIIEGKIDRYQLEKRYIRKDKSFFWGEISVSAIKDKNNKVVNTIGILNDITEQRNAKVALQESEARLITAQAVAKIGSWETDFTFTNVIWSEENGKIFGLKPGVTKLSLEEFLAIVHPEDKTLVETAFVHSIKTNTVNSLEHRIITAAGIEKIVEQRWEISRDNQGQPLRAVGTCQDITERKLAEEKLIEKEYRLQTILSAEPECVKIVDKQGILKSMNSAGLKILEAESQDQVIGKSVLGVIAPEYHKSYIEMHNKVLKGESTRMEFELIGFKGNRRWVETSAIPFQDNGETVQLAVTRDITDRKLAEAKLKLSSDKFQNLVDSTGGIVWEADAKTFNFTYVSKQAERLLGYPVKDWQVPNFWATHLHPDDKDYTVEYCVSRTKLMEAHDFTYRFRAKDGHYVWLRDIVNVVIEDGKPRWLRGIMFDITKQKETIESLRESEEKYRGLIENSPDGIVIYVDDKIAFINDEGLRMLGTKSREEVIGKPVLQFIHPDSLADVIQRMEEVVLDNNASATVEERFLDINGVPFDVEIKAIPTIFEHKASVQVIVHDITKRKQTTIELNKINRVYALISQINNLILRSKDREELFQEICHIAVTYGKFRMSWIGILDEDSKTINTAAFSGFEEGYFTKDVGISILDEPGGRGPTGTAMREGRTVICNDILNDPIMEKWRKSAIQRGYRSSISIPIIVLNKIIGSFNLYSEESNSFSSTEEIELLEKITQNIAFTLETILFEEDRKRTQEKIRQLSQAVEQSPVTIVITNTKGEIEYANPKFVETTGYSLEEIINQNPRILKSGYTSDNEYKELWQTIADGKEWHGEFHNKKKDGTLFWESASISPIVNSEGKTTHFIAIKEDITHRKNVEKELVKSKERAEESDRLKLAFLANMSHEIRTPMNGILGFTELLKEPKLSGEEQQEYINIIEKSGKRMLNIINDIISISKVESGQIEVSLSETNVNEQIEYIHTFFKPEAKQKGIQLTISKKLSPKDTLIKTDREKVYAILTNLVKNALKFTNEGSIDLGCVKKEKNLEFYVKDTGLGISPSQKKIIFERFRQANDTISRTHEGSGLGLAISKAYVEMLGGKIWVESEEGKGSAFYFTIPFNSEYKSEEKIVVEKEDLEAKNENKIKNLKVLIVEDDAISKLLITIAVKPYSKEILKVSTGLEAIEACRNNPDIDLVMMDINMPEMGGYEATKQIREFNKDLVIIAQTANGMQSDRDEAMAAGCTDYISKPINITTLGELIQKYFKK